MLAEREDDEVINAPLLASIGMDKLPGALPTVHALDWLNSGAAPGCFVSVAQGKSLKWWEMVEGGTNDAGTPNSLSQKKKGVAPRNIKELTCAEFSGPDCAYLITGTDTPSFIIWPGAGGDPLQSVQLDKGCLGIWSISALGGKGGEDDGSLLLYCGCGDATIREVSLKLGKKEKDPKSASSGVFYYDPKSVKSSRLPDTVTDPVKILASKGELTSRKHEDVDSWERIRHLTIANEDHILCGKQGGTLFHCKVKREGGGEERIITKPIAGGHAASVHAVAHYPVWGDAKFDRKTVAFATCGKVRSSFSFCCCLSIFFFLPSFRDDLTRLHYSDSGWPRLYLERNGRHRYTPPPCSEGKNRSRRLRHCIQP